MTNQMMSGSKYLNPALSISIRAEDLLSKMTIEEKIAQLSSFWFNELQENQKPSPQKMQELLKDGIGQISRVGGSSTLSPSGVAQAGNEIQQFLINHTRLGIPAILHEECCSGYMGLGGTCYPQMIGVASTWNPSLVEQMSTEIRSQMLAVGARQGLSPVLDIAVDPRWGRTEETFGEDPLLVSQFGIAFIRGLQGESLQQGLMATAKHFVGHSISLGGLNCAPVQIGPRSLWEIYLMPFQAAIKNAGLRSMMNAYPELDGDVVAASRKYLTELLRHTLGFDGLLVSDYHAISMINFFHRMTPEESKAATIALKAGIDMELPTRICYGAPLHKALEAGEISIEEIDAVVSRILQTKFKLGLFDNPYVDKGTVQDHFETPKQRRLAREIARQSIVLLKNDGLLPLKEVKTLAVIGPNANEPRHLLGDYSYASIFEAITLVPMTGSAFVSGVDKDYVADNSIKILSVLEGIQAYIGQQTQILYAHGCPIREPDRSGFAEAIEITRQADAVILVMGDKSGMIPECTCGEFRDRAELNLPGIQEELCKAIIEVGKPVVLVLINGRPLAIPWLHGTTPAILEAWLPGEEGAAAIAEVLFGASNPGGKLPITFPLSVGQVPIHYNHKPTGSHSFSYGDYADMPVKPLYPFGHGLSYTTFEYGDMKMSSDKAQAGESIDISLTVTNTGKVAGDEVVQLYICDEYASIPRPVKELKAFSRVSLNPGEKRTISFHLPVDILAFYDENLNLVVEAGIINVMLGSSSEDIRLRGSFEIYGAEKAFIKERLFTCEVTIQ
ncbi:MAG: glycoside hydrolase family 3 C-terminal domain-containing protein [Anaerolineales bacterium]|nr:glycoside hydrolase family 3 C-terminal domain-containing protein [Anaerolineales bacterium]